VDGDILEVDSMGNTTATHPGSRTNVRAWALGWVGAAVLGVANGVARRAGYEQRLGELRAHQVSTGTATVLLAAYTFLLDRRWPIASAGDTAAVGVAWAGATAAFELGLGHYVAHMPWTELIRDYDLRQGRLWSLVLLTLAASPGVAYLARTRRVSSLIPA
jgi:hypothetical protein